MENLVESLADLLERASRVIGDATGAHALHRSDDQTLAHAIAAVGDLARLVEGALIEGVAEVAERSRGRDVDARLTTRLGCHGVNELIQRLTRCSGQTAARLERAQRAVAPAWDPLTDEERPAMLPSLRDAMLAGHVGTDGVIAIAAPLLEMRDRVARDRVLLADEVLAAHARGEGPDDEPPASADILRVHAQVWATALDQDGSEPRERDIAFRRGVTLGPARDGVIPIRGALLPDVAAEFQRIIDATWSTGAHEVRFADAGRRGRGCRHPRRSHRAAAPARRPGDGSRRGRAQWRAAHGRRCGADAGRRGARRGPRGRQRVGDCTGMR